MAGRLGWEVGIELALRPIPEATPHSIAIVRRTQSTVPAAEPVSQSYLTYARVTTVSGWYVPSRQLGHQARCARSPRAVSQHLHDRRLEGGYGL